MDCEKLIEEMKWWAEECDRTNFGCQAKKTLKEAATALTTLWAENKRLKSLLGESGQDLWSKENQRADRLEAENAELRAELEQVKRALAMMWFSYVNSDKEMPHSYETEALEEAEHILGPWAECMPKYLRRGPKKR